MSSSEQIWSLLISESITVFEILVFKSSVTFLWIKLAHKSHKRAPPREQVVFIGLKRAIYDTFGQLRDTSIIFSWKCLRFCMYAYACACIYVCIIHTCIMWSSLVISTASWQCSKAVKTELHALRMNHSGLSVPTTLCIHIMCLCMYVWPHITCVVKVFFLCCTWVWTGSAPLHVQFVWAHYSRLTHCCSPQTSGGQTRLSGVWRRQRERGMENWMSQDLLSSDLFCNLLRHFHTIKDCWQ